jgi:hypothetical protein
VGRDHIPNKKEMHLAMVEDAKGILAKGEDEA